MIDDAQALAADLNRFGNLQRIVIHEHNVRGLDGGVRAHGAHGNADIRPAQHRGVVDAVPYKGHPGLLAGLGLQQFFHLFHLVGGQQLAVHLIDPQGFGHLVGSFSGVAGQHDGLAHPHRLQGLNRLCGMGLHPVGDEDVAGISAIDGHVDDGARAVAGDMLHPQPFHELVVSRGHLHAVHLGDDAIAADLLNVGNPAAVDFPAVGFPQTLADGMGGSALGQGGVLHQPGLVHLVVMDAVDLKHALRQGAGLVKDNRSGLGQDFQIIGALDQNAGLAGAADAGEEGQRNGDHQSARAAGHQERQGAVDPGFPSGLHSQRKHPHKRRNDRQGQGGIADRRSIDPGKPGDKVFGF